jgi:hypothetical protein
MIHQYGAQRFRRIRGKHVGTIGIGTIIYVQDGVRPFSFPRHTVCREPWIVEAWLNHEYFPCVKGRPRVGMMAGGHLAVIRSLRTGRRVQVADWILLACVDAGLERA